LPKYVEIAGSTQCLSGYGDANLKMGVLIESELDAILLHQYVGDKFFCIALGGCGKRPDRKKLMIG